MDVFWEEWKSPSMLKWVQILSGLETLWDLPGKGRVEGRWESITSSEPERVRCGQRGDGHGELGQSFFFFFFFAYLRVYNFPSERRVNQNNLVLLLPLAWSARLIHIGSASSHSSTTTPAVWRWQDASSGRMPSSNLLWRAVLWWQRGHVAAAPPSAAPSALCEVPPVPLPRLEDDRDAARRPCLCAPDKSARGSSAHLNYPKKAVNTIGWCGYNGSFSTCCPWGFCWKEKKKERRRSNNPVAENRCKAKFSQNHREVKTVKIVKMNKKLLNKTCPNAKWMEWIRGEISNLKNQNRNAWLGLGEDHILTGGGPRSCCRHLVVSVRTQQGEISRGFRLINT